MSPRPLEVDPKGDACKDGFRSSYPLVRCPKTNSYGVVLMSKMVLSETQGPATCGRDVPSIRTKVAMPSGGPGACISSTPEPPVPNHEYKGARP